MADSGTFNSGFQAGMDRGSSHTVQGRPKRPTKPVGKVSTSDGQQLTPSAPLKYKSFKKGGKVRKTGVYKLHAGEEVIPAKKAHKKSHKKVSAKR